MFAEGKVYEYPLASRLFYNVVGIPVTLGITVLCVYAFFYQMENFIPDGLSLLLGMSVSMVLFVGLMFNYYHLGTIIVNDRELTSLKRRQAVSIPWKDIANIYYKIGRGKQLPQDPFFTVYIFSKNKDFIIVNREIDGIQELMDTIRQFADTSRVKYISFRQLIKLFLGLYFPRLTSGRNRV